VLHNLDKIILSTYYVISYSSDGQTIAGIIAAYIYRITKNYHETEDIVQEVFIKAYNEKRLFDELVRNDKYGQLRGTGVLKLVDQDWKIVQYNLVLPIPNDLLPKYAQEIKEFYKEE